jgi:hypothetical protein
MQALPAKRDERPPEVKQQIAAPGASQAIF